jgi:hypothetical protein
VAASSPAAARILRRCPSGMPMSFKSRSLRWRSTDHRRGGRLRSRCECVAAPRGKSASLEGKVDNLRAAIPPCFGPL